jgi:hypothetical protein
MPPVGFERTILAFEREKTFHAVIGQEAHLKTLNYTSKSGNYFWIAEFHEIKFKKKFNQLQQKLNCDLFFKYRFLRFHLRKLVRNLC